MKMIKSNDLRIGNWVNDRGSQPFQILPNHILHLYQCEVAERISIDINYIPLSEDWLRKFKWANEQGMTFMFVDIEYFAIRKNIEWLEADLTFNGDSTTCSIKYVHQLQNLYFALCGEELLMK